MIARDEARLIHQLARAGQRAAALDGKHLLLWGLAAALVLAVQYVAEVRDWLPSRWLWLWQPPALIGFVAALFVTRRGPGRRLGNPVARAYTAAFAAAGLGFGIYLIAAASGAGPQPLPTALLLAASMGMAFFVLAMTTHLRWMLLPALGWWGLLAFHARQGALVPVDWLRLAAAFLVLLALPGLVLMLRRPQ
jgi:hypothetical protein